MKKVWTRAVPAAGLSLSLTLMAAAPVVASASTGSRSEMRTVCQFQRAKMPEARAQLQAGETVAQVCADKALTVAKPRSVSYGPCGESWIFNGKLGPGWIWEHYGVTIYAGIFWGTSNVHWYNYSNGRNSVYGPEYIWDSVSWQTWDGVHHAYTTGGYIGSVLEAEVITLRGYGCSNFAIAPWDFTWV